MDYTSAIPSFARKTWVVAEQPKSAGSLRGSAIGEVLPISGHDARFGEDYEAEAFVPHDLPNRVDLPGRVWMAVSEAATELGRLDAAASLIPNPQLVTRIATRREAVGTSAPRAVRQRSLRPPLLEPPRVFDPDPDDTRDWYGPGQRRGTFDRYTARVE